MCKFLNSTQNFDSYPVKIFVFNNLSSLLWFTWKKTSNLQKIKLPLSLYIFYILYFLNKFLWLHIDGIYNYYQLYIPLLLIIQYYSK